MATATLIVGGNFNHLFLLMTATKIQIYSKLTCKHSIHNNALFAAYIGWCNFHCEKKQLLQHHFLFAVVVFFLLFFL